MTRPAGAMLDRVPAPSMVLAPDSVAWDACTRRVDFELAVREVDDADTTAGRRARLRFLVCDELGRGEFVSPAAPVAAPPPEGGRECASTR